MGKYKLTTEDGSTIFYMVCRDDYKLYPNFNKIYFCLSKPYLYIYDESNKLLTTNKRIYDPKNQHLHELIIDKGHFCNKEPILNKDYVKIPLNYETDGYLILYTNGDFELTNNVKHWKGKSEKIKESDLKKLSDEKTIKKYKLTATHELNPDYEKGLLNGEVVPIKTTKIFNVVLDFTDKEKPYLHIYDDKKLLLNTNKNSYQMIMKHIERVNEKYKIDKNFIDIPLSAKNGGHLILYTNNEFDYYIFDSPFPDTVMPYLSRYYGTYELINEIQKEI
uniref:Uncharacterized protein n=1 Tax=viral metagenome TaxID=1070528 RepID=A0A6C0EBI1_9ZZZZ